MPRERRGAIILGILATGAVGWSVLSACQLPPPPTCQPADTKVICANVTLEVRATGPFTLSAHGRTLTVARPPYSVFEYEFAREVPEGTHEVSGETTADSLRVSITSDVGATGHVQRGSFQVVTGAVFDIGPCAVTYKFTSVDGKAQPFRIRYTVAAGENRC